ncbi:MAG: transglycosylase domain-containing protein, partial [Cyclobacteriaceae bacterium]|nr:transglycosylase domain-containing protein [Cyclobacteriaceae bacterium]
MKKTLFKFLRYLVLAAVVIPLVFFFMVLKGFFGPLPGDEELRNIQHMEATVVYDVKNRIIGKYYVQDRTPVSFQNISPNLINALVATEDQRFFEHQGIDLISLGRVVVKSLLLQQGAGGGSTITQQLVKNLYPRQSYGLFYYPVNKTKELILAYRLEQIYSKEKILELYLNTVSFGEDVYGIESASKRYFNTSAKSLDQQQAATLVGMLKATTSYNPVLHPEASQQRRNVVLAQMVKQEMLTQGACDSMQNLPLKTNYQKSTGEVAPYFMATIRKKLQAFLDKYNAQNDTTLTLNQSGLRVTTTVDLQMQKYAEEAMQKHMQVLQRQFDQHWHGTLWNQNKELLNNEISKIRHGRSDKELNTPVKMEVFDWPDSKLETMTPIDSLKHHLEQLQAGFLAMQPKDGAILAWVGGINYTYFPYDHVQVNAKRQVGSTFKPIVYATALENNVSPCTYFNAEQEGYEVKEGQWKPANDDGNYEGKYSMEGALESSVNTVAVKILKETGIDKTIEQAHGMGITSELPEVPSLALGVASISVEEMTTAYCTFVNGGYKVQPHTIVRIEDSKGGVLYEYKEAQRMQVLSTKTSAQMTQLLQGVVDNGTGKSVRTVYGLQNDIGGKTGTTQGNADGWFMA